MDIYIKYNKEKTLKKKAGTLHNQPNQLSSPQSTCKKQKGNVNQYLQ